VWLQLAGEVVDQLQRLLRQHLPLLAVMVVSLEAAAFPRVDEEWKVVDLRKQRCCTTKDGCWQSSHRNAEWVRPGRFRQGGQRGSLAHSTHHDSLHFLSDLLLVAELVHVYGWVAMMLRVTRPTHHILLIVEHLEMIGSSGWRGMLWRVAIPDQNPLACVTSCS
jgi:hypothetical protein